MSYVKIIEKLTSPLAFLAIAILFMFVAANSMEFRYVAFGVALAAWIVFTKQLQKKKSYQSFLPWMIGTFKSKNALTSVGLVGMKMHQAFGSPPEYENLEIVVRECQRNSEEWTLKFKNLGWHYISSIHLSHEDTLTLIAPGLSELEKSARSKMLESLPLSSIAPEIKSSELLPKGSCTVNVKKLPGFVPNAKSTIATFYAIGGDEPFAMRYRVRVIAPNAA